jgi:haloacetate dehalogenase
MFEGFRRATARIEGIDIHYVLGGSGPPLLLLHGFPQCLALWAQVAPLLARRFTVVCADLRGYGNSSKPDELADHSNYSFRAMADDQVALMHQLGFGSFAVVGHDRGGRTGHRMALDHGATVSALAVLDIVPTHTLFTQISRPLALGYWHWYFLAQPAPLPETLIGTDPDFFYERCLVGWGTSRLEDFDASQLAEYRRCWRDPRMIHGSCADYRAAATIDLALDTADLARKIAAPTLALWGSRGVMHRLFDIGAEWQGRCAQLTRATIPGGHFFVDEFPQQTAAALESFLTPIL